MAAFELSDLPYASPELVWKCNEKTCKYKRGKLPKLGGDGSFFASTEVGNVHGYHLGRDTGLRHLVTFDLAREEDGDSLILTEIEPHNQKPASSRTTHSISVSTSIKTSYEDILKITHQKRPDLDVAIWLKLKALYTTK